MSFVHRPPKVFFTFHESNSIKKIELRTAQRLTTVTSDAIVAVHLQTEEAKAISMCSNARPDVVLSLLTERLALEDLGPALGDDGARRRGRRDEPRGLQRLALNHI